MCEWFDETVGELIGYLDDQGLKENTLVILPVITAGPPPAQMLKMQIRNYFVVMPSGPRDRPMKEAPAIPSFYHGPNESPLPIHPILLMRSISFQQL